MSVALTANRSPAGTNSLFRQTLRHLARFLAVTIARRLDWRLNNGFIYTMARGNAGPGRRWRRAGLHAFQTPLLPGRQRRSARLASGGDKHFLGWGRPSARRRNSSHRQGRDMGQIKPSKRLHGQSAFQPFPQLAGRRMATAPPENCRRCRLLYGATGSHATTG